MFAQRDSEEDQKFKQIGDRQAGRQRAVVCVVLALRVASCVSVMVCVIMNVGQGDYNPTHAGCVCGVAAH